MLLGAGETIYTSTTAMLALFGHRGQDSEPTEFFKTYSVRSFIPFRERNTDVVHDVFAGEVQAEEGAHHEERGRGGRAKTAGTHSLGGGNAAASATKARGRRRRRRDVGGRGGCSAGKATADHPRRQQRETLGCVIGVVLCKTSSRWR